MKALKLLPLVVLFAGCARPAENISGARVERVSVHLGSDGLSAEQENVKRRVQLEKPGSLKHLYVISAHSGDCILYSTVSGKVTTAGKRLMPSDATKYDKSSTDYYDLGGGWRTRQLPNEDGTYGDPAGTAYIYWFDVRGNYHQHYIEGGQIVHISDVPMSWPKVILNLEATK